MKIEKEQVFYILKSFILFGAYLITAILGLEIEAISGFATLVWAPTGISLVALFILGKKYWPAIFAAAFFANFLNGAFVLTAFGIATGNTLEALVGSHLLRFFRFRPSLERVGDVFSLILVALISTLISAIIGTSTLLVSGIVTQNTYLTTWGAWWIGDMISDLIIAPFLFAWLSYPRIIFNPKRQFEELVAFVILVLISLIVCARLFNFDTAAPLTFLVYPPLIWISLRFSQLTSISAIFIMSIIAIVSTFLGFGPFSVKSIQENLFYLQSFLGITSITILLLTAESTERRNLQEKKEEFISVASHELRTPLTSMKILAYIMQKKFRKKGDTRSFSYTSKINRQIDKLSKLVLELLDTSKIQEGKMELHKERFNMSKLIKEIIEDFFDSRKEKIIFSEKISTSIFADRDRIGQVITNLLSNAIKYSPQNKNILIRMKKNNENIIIGIQDSGIGIPKGEQQNIFDRFYQLRKDRRSKGLGLGLYIAREIIERHKGEIWVESPVGRSFRNKKMKGTAFYFKLPIKG